jgi:hypothetical protein
MRLNLPTLAVFNFIMLKPEKDTDKLKNSLKQKKHPAINRMLFKFS